MSHTEVVRVEDLVVRFGGVAVLDGVTLSIKAGGFTGLIGPNGAGKTTLLRVLLGLVKPDSGRVSVFGHLPGHSHNLIGYVPQSARFERNFHITTRDVALMGRYGSIGIGRYPKKEDIKAAEEALDKVGILNLKDRRFGSLSGGQMQKALIARALSGNPRLLLMDEPTTGVDVLSQDSFYALLRELQKEMRMTIILVSHDIGVITSHVDDVICINRKVFCHGASATVLKDGIIGAAYGSETEILMHGHAVPHRLLKSHVKKKDSHG